MSVWSRIADGVGQFFALDAPQMRSISDYPDFDTQLAAIVTRNASVNPWRPASVRDALGVPSILRCVTLISNTVGAMAIEAYRNGQLLGDADRPRLIVRPNPLTRPQVFYRDTAYYMASRGEAWWIIVKRDGDGNPMSLYPARPWEITIEPTRDPLRPVIRWNNVVQANDDVRHITLMPDDNNMYRGIGPLQSCGAAISVAVEAQEFAANLFGDGGYPSTLIKSAVEVDANEADSLREQWIGKPNNIPRVIDPNIEDVKQMDVNVAGAQMLEAREYNNGDAARMFGVPGSLLDHQTPGSTLTYQNLEGEFMKFLTACLQPNYLEPIEQAMSDLLTRSTVARFSTRSILRADIKTRYQVYQIGITSGVLTPELAQQMEGITAGDIENAPVPLAQPQAIPTSLPLMATRSEFRCDGMHTKRRSGVTTLARCNALLGMGDFTGTCRRCKKVYPAHSVAN